MKTNRSTVGMLDSFQYFPGREEVTGLLQKVAAWLKTAGDELTGDQWINTLDEIQVNLKV